MRFIKLLFILFISVLFTACGSPYEYATEGTKESRVILTPNVVHSGSVGSTSTDGTLSYYQFTSIQEGNYTITISSQSDLSDFSMGVSAQDGSYYKGSDNGEPLIAYLQAETIYYLSTAAGGIVYYDLLITSPPTINTSPTFPAKLVLEQNLTAFLSDNDTGYYRFDVNESANYSIDANNFSSNANLDFELYSNGFYDTYIDSANSDNDMNESMNLYLEAGRYNLIVRNYGDDVSFNLFINQR